jgi:ectoine hydroxylase-related dioxygenase (phytanoyl-CoA dioxygenase family)
VSISRSVLDAWSHEIDEAGYSVAPAVFSADEVAVLREALDAVFRREAALAVPRGWVNDTYRVAYMLPAKSPELLRVSWHPGLLELVRSVLGDDCVLGSLNGFTPTPSGRRQALHRDQPSSVTAEALHVNAVCVLDEFTCDNGATRIVPGSHRDDTAPAAPADPDALELRSVPVEAAAGSVIGYRGDLWHGSGENRTTSPRRSLHAFYVRPWVLPHWDVPASLPDHVVESLSAARRRLLGFETRPRRYDTTNDRVIR